MFVPIYAFWCFCPLLGVFANFGAITNFSKNLSERITNVLNAAFVPYLTFLGLLGFEISLGEKPLTQTPARHIIATVNH